MLYFFYYFPLGLDVRPRRCPWATIGLIGACVAVYLMQRYAPYMYWSNYGAFVMVPESPSPSSMILNAYFHGGWLHLVSNMLSLAVFGPALEDRLGARRYLLLYHVSNVAANIVQSMVVLLCMPEQAGYGVLGASGAIAGIMGLFAVRLYFARLRVAWWAFLPLQAYTRAGTAYLPALLGIVLWFAMQLVMALLQREGVGAGVACGSHLGGLAAGIGLALAFGLRNDARTDAHMHRGKFYLGRAAWFAAQAEFLEYVRRRPHDEQGHLELARTYRITGRQALADQHYRDGAEILAAAKRLDRVEEIYGEAQRGNPHFAFSPALQMQLAVALDRSLKTTAAASAYTRVAESAPQSPQAAIALQRAVRLARRDRRARAQVTARIEDLALRFPSAPGVEIARFELHARSAA